MLENNIKSLIKILEESKVDELEISTFWGKQKIKIRKNINHKIDRNIEIIPSPPSPAFNAESNEHPSIDKNVEEKIDSKIDVQNSAPLEKENTVTIKAPLVGTFYQSSKPGSPPFISEGDTIKTGQVLCIIEAMKIFNEIESEVSGRVENILIKDGTPVEYDQDLIIISPE